MALAAIPTIAAIASPERVISAPKAVKEIPPTELKPKAHTRMSAAIIVFLDLVKSTWFSTTFLIPIAEIIPYRIRDTPPMMAAGIEEMRKLIFGTKDSRTAKQAAMRMTAGS